MFATSHSRLIASSTCLTLILVLALDYPYSSKARVQLDDDEPIACGLSVRELVTLTASVSDENGKPVTELSHENFEVFDNDILQPIAFFISEDKPVSIVVVFDLSDSVAKSSRFSAVCQGILRFKQGINKSSEFIIIGADRNPILITDWTSNNDVLIEGLSRLALSPTQSRTGIYDACQLAMKKLSDRDNSRLAVLLITNGRDGTSSSTPHKLSELSKRSNGLIYVLSPSSSKRSLGTSGQQILARLSLDSGGSTFFPSSDSEVQAAFSAITASLGKQYVIGYYPSDNKRDGSWHSVRVGASPIDGEQNDSELHVRTRSGYYAPLR
ncbi:MAG TPA: VWA domain-containing protein [Blastocatellia bacterium]|nr:VWA domain-containing protein [Blastocatellia bacterium]